MDIRMVREKGRIVLEITGRIDAISASDFQEQSLAALNDCEQMLLLDCSAVEYVSSAGLRSFLVIAKMAAARNISVVLCNLQNIVREVFEISGFDSFFEVRHGCD